MLCTLCYVINRLVCTLCSVGYARDSVLCRLCSVYSVLCRLYSVLCALSAMLCTHSLIPLSVFCLCRLCSVLCAHSWHGWPYTSPCVPASHLCKITSSHCISMKEIEEHNRKMDESFKRKSIYIILWMVDILLIWGTRHAGHAILKVPYGKCF